MPAIPAIWRFGQKYNQFEASLGYIAKCYMKKKNLKV
jgi:hypothetical protein